MTANSKEGNGIYDIIVYIMMAIAVVYVIAMAVLGKSDTTVFKIILGIWIIIAVAIADFAGPLLRGKLDDVEPAAYKYYVMYAVCDAVFYMGMYVFVVNLRNATEVLHYVYFGTGLVFYGLKIVCFNRFNGLIRVENKNKKHKPSDDEEVDTLSEDDELKVFIFREKENKN